MNNPMTVGEPSEFGKPVTAASPIPPTSNNMYGIEDATMIDGLPPGTDLSPVTAPAPIDGVPHGTILTPNNPYDIEDAPLLPVGPVGESNPFASLPEAQIMQQGLQGLKETGEDIWSTVKGAVTHPLETVAPQVAGAYDAIKNTIPVLHVYEQARSQGKGVLDSLKAANEQAAKQNQAVDALKARIEEFKKNPTAAQVRLVGDAASAALASWGGEAIGARLMPEAGAAEVSVVPEAETAEPSLFQKITKGKEVAQKPATAALRTGAEGVTTVQPESLRTVLEEPIDRIEGEAKANYRQIDKASGTDFKSLNEKVSNTDNQMRQLTDTEADQALAEKLEASRTGLIDKIAKAKQQALDNGVDPGLLDKADAQFKQAQALRDVESKVFKNPNIVQGNTAMGTPETINVDSAVKALQKLQDSRPYGGSRLEQALGKENANQLLKDIYSAQRAGASAAKIRARIITALKVAGVGYGVHEVLR